MKILIASTQYRGGEGVIDMYTYKSFFYNSMSFSVFAVIVYENLYGWYGDNMRQDVEPL